MSGYELPKQIEAIFASLSKKLTLESNGVAARLLVNAKIHIHEGWEYDNWDGGIHGHALALRVPEVLFYSLEGQRESLAALLTDSINSLKTTRDEYVCKVFIEPELAADDSWRQNSGLLLQGGKHVSPSAIDRIWGQSGFRVFLSHKADERFRVAQVKRELKQFGIVAFVAHQDIQPTKEWQLEIENALMSMDAFVAFLTPGFHDSDWTDQEVGFALARCIPVVAIRLGKDPYGFIGKFQAVSCTWEQAPFQVSKHLMGSVGAVDALIAQFESANTYDHVNLMAKLLNEIMEMSESQVDRLLNAFNRNGQVSGSFAMNGMKPSLYGPGILPKLNKISKRKFTLRNNNGQLVLVAG